MMSYSYLEKLKGVPCRGGKKPAKRDESKERKPGESAACSKDTAVPIYIWNTWNIIKLPSALVQKI